MIAIVDLGGVYGSMLHYGLIIAFVGSAFIIFLYLWSKNKLGMDEEASLQMMRDEESNNELEKKP